MHCIACIDMSKYVIFFLFLTIHCSSCGKSFTIVVDTTRSMRQELSIVKANIGKVLNTVNLTEIDSFILVPFKDTVIETPTIARSPGELVTRLNSLSTSGGFECPEDSLTALETALRASEKESYIFVFTDAYAKDYSKYRNVENLCKESNSQVYIILSGNCSSQTSPSSDVELYYDVTRACSGAVFSVSAIDYRQVFTFMKNVISVDWTNVTPYKKFTDSKLVNFSVDSFTTDFVIVITGTYTSIVIQRSDKKMSSVEMDKVIETRESLVVRLVSLEAGDYIADIRGDGPMYITSYERNGVPFEYGFSTLLPRNLKETSKKPIAGWTNYILIKTAPSIKLRSVEWLIIGDSVKQILLPKQNPSGCYVASVFVEPGKTFRFWIIGETIETRHDIKGSSKIFASQASVTNATWTQPQAEILDTDLNLVDFGTSLKLACKIIGYPKPNIRWVDENDETLPSEAAVLEMSSIYISYVTISNVTKNSTITCNCENTKGADSKSIEIYVNRTFFFNVVKAPEDASVNYGRTHKIYCQIDSYPQSVITWLVNGTEIQIETDSNVDIDYISEDTGLVIESMNFKHVGKYECRASNGVTSQNLFATIQITGVEKPEIEDGMNEIATRPDDKTTIACRITKGIPTPDITWKFKGPNDFIYGNLPEGAVTSDGKLEIFSVKSKHIGQYRCIAGNILGEDSKIVNLKVQYAPIIKDSDLKRISVTELDEVTLSCDVDAIPEATVRWEMSQDDMIIVLDERHKTYDNNTHSFTAYNRDSGSYHCIAENSVGRAEKTVIVNVLVPPYIKGPESTTITANIGATVILSCNVKYGNPVPSIKWEFISNDSVSTILERNNSTNNLQLTKVSRNDEGTYLCIAENVVNKDRIIYQLRVL